MLKEIKDVITRTLVAEAITIGRGSSTVENAPPKDPDKAEHQSVAEGEKQKKTTATPSSLPEQLIGDSTYIIRQAEDGPKEIAHTNSTQREGILPPIPSFPPGLLSGKEAGKLPPKPKDPPRITCNEEVKVSLPPLPELPPRSPKHRAEPLP